MSRRSVFRKSGRDAGLFLDAIGERRARLVGDVDEGDARALPRKALGQRRADAGPAAGDQHGGALRSGKTADVFMHCSCPETAHIVSGKQRCQDKPGQRRL